MLGKELRIGILEYGVNAENSKEFKEYLELFIEGMAVMKEIEEEEKRIMEGGEGRDGGSEEDM